VLNLFIIEEALGAVQKILLEFYSVHGEVVTEERKYQKLNLGAGIL
jgi:hypothetical protein